MESRRQLPAGAGADVGLGLGLDAGFGRPAQTSVGESEGEVHHTNVENLESGSR